MARALVAVLGLLATAGHAVPRDEAAFARALLAKLQPVSFAANVELCGFIGRDARGVLTATRPARGTQGACASDRPAWMEVTASYHTHAGFDPLYLGELPSAADLRSDRRLGIDGWIATPGGRLWHVDHRAMVARQACGPGCLPAAPGFRLAQAGEVAKAYTYAGLRARLGL